jgi:hypothetical protein
MTSISCVRPSWQHKCDPCGPRGTLSLTCLLLSTYEFLWSSQHSQYFHYEHKFLSHTYGDCVWHFESKKHLHKVSYSLPQRGFWDYHTVYTPPPFQHFNRVAVSYTISYKYFAFWDHPNTDLWISYSHY